MLILIDTNIVVMLLDLMLGHSFHGQTVVFELIIILLYILIINKKVS